MAIINGTTTVATGDFDDAIFSVDGTKLYAISGNKLQVIRVSDGTTLQTFTIGSELGAIDISQDGRFLAIVEQQPSSGVGTLYVVDLATGSVSTFSFPGTAALYDVAFLSDGTVIVSQQAAAPLLVVNLQTGDSYSATVEVPANATLSVSADATYVIAQPHQITWPIYAFAFESGSGYTVFGMPDPYAGASVPPPDSGVGAVSPDGSLVVQGMNLVVYDGAFSTSFSLADNYPYLDRPSGIAFSPSGDKLYLLDAQAQQVVVFSTSTWKVLGAYSVGTNITDPSADLSESFGGLLRVSDDGRYISVIGTSEIRVIDLSTAEYQSSNGDDVLTGSGKLLGFGGNDSLTAVGEFTAMYGGVGNDAYYVSSNWHYVNESPGEGQDTVHSSLDYELGANVENLKLTGTASIDGTGNELNNVITGNAGRNVLAGLAGGDQLAGGAGNDILDGGAGNDLLDGGPASTPPVTRRHPRGSSSAWRLQAPRTPAGRAATRSPESRTSPALPTATD